jgi:hypothetical protein
MQTYKNFNVLVVSTENITQNWYFGNQRSMLIPNCLFRVGGASLVLSNKATHAWQAKCALPRSCSIPCASELDVQIICRADHAAVWQDLGLEYDWQIVYLLQRILGCYSQVPAVARCTHTHGFK